jgi:hypothetical protein
MEMTSRQMLDAVDQALAEVSRRLESGELDGSGRYYTDEELKEGSAIDAKNRCESFQEKPTVPKRASLRGLKPN